MKRAKRSLFWALIACAAVLGAAWMLSRQPQPQRQTKAHAAGHVAKKLEVKPPSSRVNFTRDVAPILFGKCAPCHDPGGSAPFSLLTYREAKLRAGLIAVATRNRLMPPWLPAPGYGDFIGENERRLTDQEIRTIQEWVREGTPEGNPADLPPVPKLAQGWRLGRPDLILRLARPYLLPAHAPHGKDVFRNFVIPVPADRPRHVRAIEFHPGRDLKVFHHANILVDPTGLSELRDGRDGQEGFSGMDLEIESDSFNPEGHFLFWKPGTVPAAESDGISWKVDKGTDLVLNMHMRPDGKPHAVQPTVGIYFTDKASRKQPMLLELQADQELNIPPRAKHFVVTDQFKLPLDVEVLAVYPHAHYVGKDLQGYATMPDGAKRWLIWIRDWNFDWQSVFRYVKPVFLPKGTVIHMHYTYDNSSDNPRNPNHPPKRVVGGNQGTDEMAHFWLQVLPVDNQNQGIDPRLVLQEAMMRHDVERDPRDFIAMVNLGAALQAEGKPGEACDYYRKALEIRPGDAIAENSLGACLQAQGNVMDAASHYRAALRANPDYANANYNLGQILLGESKFEEAAERFRTALRLNPDDASAHNDLGSALASQEKWREATAEFERALQLDPQNANAHDNLGYILARQGELRQALVHFEKAVQLEPQRADLHTDLGVALLGDRKADQAIKEFRRALKIDPQNATARSNLQRAIALLNRTH